MAPAVSPSSRESLEELLKKMAQPAQASKDYKSKYPKISSEHDAKVYVEHENNYYKIYDKAYTHLTNIQKDLGVYIDRMNSAASDVERQNAETKLRHYVSKCLTDKSFIENRRTIANMTSALNVLRKRLNAYYDVY